HLHVSLNHLIALRARTIRAVLEEFEPDVLIVDKVPRGAVRELDPSLELLHERGRTRCVLGLRDVLDHAGAVHREWSSDSNVKAVRNYYDAVWVYGGPRVYDSVREYRFPAEVAGKVRYTGYLGQRGLTAYPDGSPDSLPSVPKGPLILCLVGGWQGEARRPDLLRGAERLRDVRLLHVRTPDRLSRDAHTERLARPKATPAGPRDLIDLDGLERVPRLLEEVLGAPTHTADGGRHEGA